jgi:hypothetical protein
MMLGGTQADSGLGFGDAKGFDDIRVNEVARGKKR